MSFVYSFHNIIVMYILLTKQKGNSVGIPVQGLGQVKADILPIQSRVSEVYKIFITRLKKVFIDKS